VCGIKEEKKSDCSRQKGERIGCDCGCVCVSRRRGCVVYPQLFVGCSSFAGSQGTTARSMYGVIQARQDRWWILSTSNDRHFCLTNWAGAAADYCPPMAGIGRGFRMERIDLVG